MKKNILTLSILALCLAFLQSCNGPENAIKESAMGYLNAMGNYQFDEALPYASEKTRTETIEFIQGTIMPLVDTAYIKANTPATIEITKVDCLSDSTAKVAYVKHTPLQPRQNGDLDMILENGKWVAEVIMVHPNFSQPDTTKLDSIGRDLKVADRDVKDLQPAKQMQRPQIPTK